MDDVIQNAIKNGIDPAVPLLPEVMESPAARVMLLAIGLQESRLIHRRQINGPARGLWQFEKGTRESRGGVWGVYLHPASAEPLKSLCLARSVNHNPDSIYAALEYDDVLACGAARLLLWTDPGSLPKIGDAQAGWDLYMRTWRPGKPHRNTWDALYAQAVKAVAA